MKIKSLLVVLVTIAAFAVHAQEKMTTEQWEQAMQSNSTKAQALQNEVNSLKTDVENLKATSSKLVVGDCDKETLEMVNPAAKNADVDAFRKAVNELEGKIRREEPALADRQKDLDALKANALSALPEFFDRVHNQMQNMLNDWAARAKTQEVVEKSKDIMYTVVKGDCLWFIAKKKDHYGNGFAWPKIYQANKEQIKNPNLIYPKQNFKIPPLTEDEKSKFEKLRKSYKPAPAK